MLLEAGVPLKDVSERLGHSTISIAADTYQHVPDHMLDEAADLNTPPAGRADGSTSSVWR